MIARFLLCYTFIISNGKKAVLKGMFGVDTVINFKKLEAKIQIHF